MQDSEVNQAIQLPMREGIRPQTSIAPPHHQIDQNSPPPIYDKLKNQIFSLPHITKQASLVSAPGTDALWLNETITGGPPEAFIIWREFGHLHPLPDSSLHLKLPMMIIPEVLEKGWGELLPHVEAFSTLPNTLMIFGPRNNRELDTVLHIVDYSYKFAQGKFGAEALEPLMDETI